MKRLCLFLFLLSIFYGVIATLFMSLVTTDCQFTWLRLGWLLAGALTLLGTAIELTWMAAWLVTRLFSLGSGELVPDRLWPDDRELIRQNAPRLAIIMPANGEVATHDDLTAFEDRLFRIIRNAIVPSIVEIKLVLLFDSDPTKPGNETAPERERELIVRVNRVCGPGSCCYREYRDKPPNRKSKQGSIERFLEEEGSDYKFIMVLDADSTFPRPVSNEPDTVDIIDRLVATMLQNDKLAMIQCSIRIPDYYSILGWLQNVNARLAVNYHGPLNGLVLQTQLPSYGHNVIFRASDLIDVYETGIPQNYLSHDYVEAALLAEKGRWCAHSQVVATNETAEETIDSFLQRDLRWQRGNSQWTHLLCERRNLPLSVRYYLVIGIFSYLLPLMAALFLIGSAALMMLGQPFVSNTNSGAAIALISCVVVALIGPKLAASLGPNRQMRLTMGELFSLLTLNVFVCPAIAVYSGLAFVFAPVAGKGWKLRKSRNTSCGIRKSIDIMKLFSPVSLLGFWLTFMAITEVEFHAGGLVLLAGTFALAISPITAMVVSLPLFRESSKQVDST